jgi:signal transduction histidine kinase
MVVVRHRIVTLTVVAAILAISLFGLPLGYGVAKYFASDERAELERTADAAALSISDELSDPQPTPVLPSSVEEDRVGLYTPSGQLRTGVGPQNADPIVSAARNGTLASGEVGDNLVTAVPIVHGTVLVGIVRASTPHAELYQRTAVTWLAMSGLAVLAIGATWLVARRFATRLARPLENLSKSAERLGEGDFTVRAHRAGIPEIDQVADTLDVTAERIGETLDRERAFSANASHQLRTPLTGLRLQLEAALESPDQHLRAGIAAAIASADRLEGTIDDLLALARQTRTQRAVLDLPLILEEIEKNWHGLLARHNRALRIVSHDPPAPRAAAAAVRQILGVLLDNAMTHGRGLVTVIARDAGGVLAIDVTDEGDGINDEQDLFAHDRSSSKTQATQENSGKETQRGNGIGLALARSLAEAEGGRLRLTKPKPATFTLLLPVDSHEESLPDKD